MDLDPRTPVLVGAGQLSNRVDRGAAPLEPVDLLAEAVRAGAADTGAADPGAVLAAVDTIRIVAMLSWRYRNPGLLVAERIGATSLRSSGAGFAGGNTPQSLVNRTCLDILAGTVDVAVVGGAESWRTRSAARAAGTDLGWVRQGDDVPAAEELGAELLMWDPDEVERGVTMPVQVYPMFESALRAAAGATHAEWAAHLGRLWSRFSEVAAANPHAWVREAFSAEEVVRPSADNRMIGFPYPKRLNSNAAVEQGAALLLCSAEAAERLGVPRERWVFPLSGTDGADAYTLTEREDLRSSPAIRVAGAHAFSLAGVGPDDIAHADLYSCFPSAVQIAAAELGFGLDRDLTVTGGLAFAGGPWNDYVTHAIATMVTVLREHPGQLGLVSANGGFVTKHAIGLYGTEPPARPFGWAAPQEEIDAAYTRCSRAGLDYTGPATVEAYTVMHDRDGGPELGLCAFRTPAGARGFGRSTEPAVLEAMLEEEFVGRACAVEPDGALLF